VAKLERLQVRAFVDEPEIGRLAQGQIVEVKWDAMPGRTWQGVVTRVPTVVTAVGTRTVGEITCEIPNADHKLLPNVNVNVTIVTAQHNNALTISREAIHDMNGKRYVYQILDDRLHSAEIQTGITSLTRVEVTHGLAEGAQVALSAINPQTLRNGMEVKVVER
jgi:HlyD family secretion protein